MSDGITDSMKTKKPHYQLIKDGLIHHTMVFSNIYLDIDKDGKVVGVEWFD